MQTGSNIGLPQTAVRLPRLQRIRQYWRTNGLAYWFILPSLLFLLAVEFVPLAKGLNEALYYHNRLQPWLTQFVGLDNFVQALHDHAVWVSLRTSVIMVVGIVGFSYALGLLAAVLLNQELRLRGVYRALILVPWVVPFVVSFISWQWMLSDQSGIINQTLLNLHIINTPILFFADPKLAMVSIILVGVWQQFPFLMITMLAALSAIPDDLSEAAAIDGASRWQTFRHITFPLILPISIIATLLQSIWTFNNFGLPFVLTGGGPANATTPLILLSYKEAFQHYNIGYGTSLAVIAMGLMLALGVVYLRVQARQGSVYR
jgi:multiple sugar transport system permease protein